MPFVFREGLVFIPGDKAIYKNNGEECIVEKLISGKDKVLSAYQVKLVKSNKILFCALDEITLIPNE